MPIFSIGINILNGSQPRSWAEKVFFISELNYNSMILEEFIIDPKDNLLFPDDVPMGCLAKCDYGWIKVVPAPILT